MVTLSITELYLKYILNFLSHYLQLSNNSRSKISEVGNIMLMTNVFETSGIRLMNKVNSEQGKVHLLKIVDNL